MRWSCGLPFMDQSVGNAPALRFLKSLQRELLQYLPGLREVLQNQPPAHARIRPAGLAERY